METLFPIEYKYPEGFYYHPEYLSEKEEKNLMLEIEKIKLHPFSFQGYVAKREVASFGYDYSFDKRTISKGEPFPAGFRPVIQKIAASLALAPTDFAELLITRYDAGSVINWHRDAPPFELIAGLSLLSDCKFRLRPHRSVKRSRSSVLSFPVSRRSMYVISGPARKDWEHSIPAVKEERYSITLRTLSPGAAISS